jgi:hypothetical protein
MSLRKVLALTLGTALAFAPCAPAATAPGLLKGTVTTINGSRVADVDVELVNLDSGALTRLRTDANGAFEAQLDPASYKLEVQKGYTIVRGPRSVSLVTGDTTPAEIVVTDLAAAAGSRSETVAATPGTPKRGADIIALALFTGVLGGAAIYAATREGDPDRRPPPTTSPSR